MLPTFVAALAFVANAAEHADYRSPWFIASAVAVLLATVIVWYARFRRSNLWLPEPDIMHAAMLHYDPARFKADLIHTAGMDARRNSATIQAMYHYSLAASVTFAAGGAAFAVWMAQQL